MAVMVATRPDLLTMSLGRVMYRYARSIPHMDMYGLRFPQSKMMYLSEISPNTGLIHHGADAIPTLMVISTGENLRCSIISKFMAMAPNDKQNPKVK